MKLRTRSYILIVMAAALVQAQDANGPDPREIPIPRIKTPMGTLPGAGQLPVRKELPDVMVMNDGTNVTTRAQWQKRRKEMTRILEYYAVGQMPPPPGNVKGKEVSSETVLDGDVKYRLVHLTFGPSEKLSLDIGIFTPLKGGPFPAIILQSGTPPGATALPRLPPGPNQGRGEDVLLMVGPAPAPDSATATAAAAPGRAGRGGLTQATAQSMATLHADVFRRGYALVVFNPNDCAEDTTLRNPDGSWAFRTTRFYPEYPGYDWGILAGWAWGASRVADYLEKDAAIDKIETDHHRRLAEWQVVHDRGGVRRTLDGRPGGNRRWRRGGLPIRGPAEEQKRWTSWRRSHPELVFSPNLHEFWGPA